MIRIILLLIFSFTEIFYKNLYIVNYDSTNFNIIFFKENYLNIIKFFNFPNNIINIIIISYLFLLIVIIVKITNFLKGPIKSIN